MDADGLCCRLEKALSNKQDTIDSSKMQKLVLPVMTVLPQTSSTIDYKELQIGKLIGSGEFAGEEDLFFFLSMIISDVL